MNKLKNRECDSVLLMYNGKETCFTVDTCDERTFFRDECGSYNVSIEEMLDGKWFVNELWEDEEEE